MSLAIIEHGEYSSFMYHTVELPDGVTVESLQSEWVAYKDTHDFDARLDDLPEGPCYSDLCQWLSKYHPEIKSVKVPILREE